MIVKIKAAIPTGLQYIVALYARHFSHLTRASVVMMTTPIVRVWLIFIYCKLYFHLQEINLNHILP